MLKDKLEIYYTGYVQDAQKEYAESELTYAIVREMPLPRHDDWESSRRLISTAWRRPSAKAGGTCSTCCGMAIWSGPRESRHNGRCLLYSYHL